MFITLKSYTRGLDSEMEQVARSHAEGRDGPRGDIGKRPACVACQKRKARCAGPLDSCYRCREKSITCIPTEKRPRNSTRLKRGVRDVYREGATISVIPKSPPSMSVAPSIGAIPSSSGLHLDDTSPQLPQITVHALENAARVQDEAPNMSDAQQPNLTSSEFLDTNFETEYISGPSRLDSLESVQDKTQLNHNPSLISDHLFDPDFLRWGCEQPFTLSLDPSGALHGAARPTQQELTPTSTPGPIELSTLSQYQKSSPGGTYEASSAQQCTCMEDARRVLKHLEDDDFKLSTLTLDQALQLQKWIMYQCCLPLDCASCHELPQIYAVLVPICGRLTNMIECVHRRVVLCNPWPKTCGVNQQLSHAGAAALPWNAQEAPPSLKDVCHPEIFSAECREPYTDEEQCHMMHVLLKLQVRYVTGLLGRVLLTASRAGGTQVSELESMMETVRVSGEKIKAVFEKALKAFG